MLEGVLAVVWPSGFVWGDWGRTRLRSPSFLFRTDSFPLPFFLLLGVTKKGECWWWHRSRKPRSDER